MIHAAGILDRVSGLAAELNLANLEPQIAACRCHLNEDHGIDVAVFGRFKAGKSSFLNHLTSRSVLPVGVVPLTAVITRLRYGPTERAEVRFLNGDKKEISLTEIGLYVGENENPDNQKQVASVEVDLPTLKPFAPLQFVDTPGLGSAFAHNTDATFNWLPNVGAAFVAVSADAPLSERDLALLEELRRHTPQIVVLLTKADLLAEPQRAEVLQFVHRQLLRRWTAEFPVFFYSVRSEASGWKADLEQKLLLPLLGHRAETADQIARYKLLSLVTRTLDYLQIALSAATQADSERQALREKLADERRQFDLLRSELNVLAREWSANALEEYLARLQPTRFDLQRKVTRELRAQFLRWNLRLPRLLEAWRGWLGDFLKSELAEVSHGQRAMFCEPLRNAQTQLARALRAFQDRLMEHVRSALGISLTPHDFALEVSEPASPPVHVAYAFDAAFTSIGWFIPFTVFRSPIERVLLRKARYEIEKNLSRLAADWHGRVAGAIDELRRQAEKQALDELAAFERMLAQTASKVPELQRAAADLRGDADWLSSPQNSPTPSSRQPGSMNHGASPPRSEETLSAQ